MSWTCPWYRSARSSRWPPPGGRCASCCPPRAGRIWCYGWDWSIPGTSMEDRHDAHRGGAGCRSGRAAILAADTYGGYFPMLMTAAGTAKPAQVLVLGVGVAGLAAIGTARRLGAIVTGYDIRPESREEVRSLGARFLDLGLTVADGTGGYARALSDEEREAQQEALQQRIGDFDVVITTAQVPGRRPPLLVAEEALK